MSLKILLALKPGDSRTQAVARVRSLASGTNVDVLLFSAVFDHGIENGTHPDDPGRTRLVDAVRSAERSVLRGVAETLKSIAGTVDVEVEWVAEASRGVADAAERFGADLIIVSSPHHSALARAFFNYNDIRIPRHTKIPVLLAVGGEHRGPRSVLVGVRLTPEDGRGDGLDTRLLEQGRRYAKIFDAELHVAHAFPSLVAVQVMSFQGYPSAESVYDDLKETHKDAFERFLIGENIDDERAHLDDRAPGVALAGIAEQVKCGLFVVGLHDRTDLDAMVVANTAEHLLARSPCDLLLCR